MNIPFLAGTRLFAGCPEADIALMARHFPFRVARYPKGAVILAEGETVTSIALLLSGNVRLEHSDAWGSTVLLGIVEPGDVFAEAYACVPGEPLLINAVADEDCELLLLSVPRLFSPCPACASQNQLIRNLLRISAEKNLQLSRRSLHTMPKTIRGRLTAYFSDQSAAQGSRSIVIPFNRQQLADYLNVERTALSKELGKMRREGLIDFRRNRFVLHGAD